MAKINSVFAEPGWEFSVSIFSAKSKFVCGDCGRYNSKSGVEAMRYQDMYIAMSRCNFCGMHNAFTREKANGRVSFITMD